MRYYTMCKKKINEQAYDPNIQKAQTKIYRQAVAMHNKAQNSGMEGDAAYIATVFHAIRKANNKLYQLNFESLLINNNRGNNKIRTCHLRYYNTNSN